MARAGRDDGQNSVYQQVFSEPVAVIALVREQPLGRGQWRIHQVISSGIIRRLAARQDEANRESLIVTSGVDFARKATA